MSSNFSFSFMTVSFYRINFYTLNTILNSHLCERKMKSGRSEKREKERERKKFLLMKSKA
jgi:hypothetical protein